MFKQRTVCQSTPRKTTPRIWLLVLLILASLACSLGRLSEEPPRKVVQIKKILATLTPTSVAGSSQVVVAAEAPDLPVEVSSAPQELIAETAPMPTATAVAVAQATAQPVNSSTGPTAAPTSTSLPNPTITSDPAEAIDPPSPTPLPLPSPTPESAISPVPESNPVPSESGWAFIGVDVSYQDEDGVIIDGDIINNTGAPQEIVKLTGTIYDSQGQGIANVDDAAAYWPLETVPAGGQVPFEMVVYHIQDVTDFDLDVVSQPSRENPRQDFELSDLDPSVEEGSYCVTGKLWNRGDPLLDYLLVLVVLYNDQNQVINFGTFQGNSPEEVRNDEALNFEICSDSYNHQIARHELRAVGL